MKNILLPITVILTPLFICGCLLEDPQTPPDESSIPWDKLSGKIVFVNLDEGKYSNTKHLYVIDGVNKKMKEVNKSTEIYFDFAVISSFGDQIAYSGNSGLEVLNINTGGVSKYSNCYTASYNRKNEIAYYFVNDSVQEFRINHQKISLPIRPSSKVDFGPNDQFMIYSNAISDSRSKLVKYDFSTIISQILLDPTTGDTAVYLSNPSVSPDGKKILYSKSFRQIKRWSEIWMIDSDGGNDTLLLQGNNLNYDYASWSPNGKQFVYSYIYSPDYFDGGYSVNRYTGLFDMSDGSKQSLVNINGYYTSWSK